MAKILALTATPLDKVRLRLDEEIREIRKRLSFIEGNQLKVEWEGAVKSQELLKHLMQQEADIVHFSGHGTEQGEMVLEDDAGYSNPVPPETLQKVFDKLKGNIRCVVLNSCYSQRQADAIAKSIDCVIGMSSAVSDQAAIAFAAGFYQAIGFGQSIQTAFDLACLEIALLRVPEEHTPQLRSRTGVDPGTVYLTGRPELWAEFVLDSKSGKPLGDDNGYTIRVFVKQAPPETISVVYQNNDSSFESENLVFEEISTNIGKGFETSIESYGNFEIRATIWLPTKGLGVKAHLVPLLERSHGKQPNGAIGRALASVRRH